MGRISWWMGGSVVFRKGVGEHGEMGGGFQERLAAR